MGDQVTCRLATPEDLTYIDSLQWKNAKTLSFFPRLVLERECRAQHIILAEVNGEPAGYVYHGALRETFKIHQACIQYDLRGMLYGAQLVSWVLKLGEKANVNSVKLRCGSDIDANWFWRAMGFYCEAVVDGGFSRGRKLNQWVYYINEPLFKTVVEPSSQAKDYSLRKLGGVANNKFLRGAASEKYRRQMLELERLK